MKFIRRKSRIFALLVTVIMLCSMLGGFAEAEKAGKLTVMVYMCGSNLESGYGSASKDLDEMVSAGIGQDVTVLVMAGGTGFGRKATIRKRRRLWKSERKASVRCGPGIGRIWERRSR